MGQDWELWQRTIIEALRPIDPPALFWVGLSRIDFRGASDHRLEAFPADEMVAFVNEWLASLDPGNGEATTDWSGGGVDLGFRAKGRRSEARGWTAMPSLNLLEQRMADMHLVDGGRRQFTTLSLEEVEQLARGELRVVGQGASYQDTFQAIAAEMRRFNLLTVGDLAPDTITVYAGAVGLVEAPPTLGNFEREWRAMFGDPPE